MDISLRGRPVVTGQERGIASAASYEAKAMGVKRAMRLDEVKRVCPDAVILPSNYELYSLMSHRMKEIVKRYSPRMQENGIDECFADMTGLRRPLKLSYEDMAIAIKHDLEHELGMTFSIGLAPTKTLAKVASNFSKPSGCVVIPGRRIHYFLKDWDVGDVWGIGKQTANFLKGKGIHTALDFANQSEAWIGLNAHKPLYEIWLELRGNMVKEVKVGPKTDQKSIQKTRTFTPPSKDKARVFAELSKNVENACIKARRYGLRSKKVSFFLKTQKNFHYHGTTVVLDAAVQTPEPLLALMREHFDRIYQEGVEYRKTGITLHELEAGRRQQDLFGETAKVERFEELHQVIDEVDARYGKHTVFLGSSFSAMVLGSHWGKRGAPPKRWREHFKGETMRKRLNVPLLGEVV